MLNITGIENNERFGKTAIDAIDADSLLENWTCFKVRKVPRKNSIVMML